MNLSGRPKSTKQEIDFCNDSQSDSGVCLSRASVNASSLRQDLKYLTRQSRKSPFRCKTTMRFMSWDSSLYRYMFLKTRGVIPIQLETFQVVSIEAPIPSTRQEKTPRIVVRLCVFYAFVIWSLRCFRGGSSFQEPGGHSWGVSFGRLVSNRSWTIGNLEAIQELSQKPQPPLP